jgi:hypothetical protein
VANARAWADAPGPVGPGGPPGPAGPAGPQGAPPPGSDVVAWGAASVNAAAQLRAANPTRRSLSVQPITGDIYVGSSAGVTPANGTLIPAGALYADSEYTGAVFVVAAAGAVDVRWREVG